MKRCKCCSPLESEALQHWHLGARFDGFADRRGGSGAYSNVGGPEHDRADSCQSTICVSPITLFSACRQKLIAFPSDTDSICFASSNPCSNRFREWCQQCDTCTQVLCVKLVAPSRGCLPGAAQFYIAASICAHSVSQDPALT